MVDTVKIPLAVDLKIEGFSGSGLTDYSSGIVNGLIRKDNNKITVTQRPSIDIFEDSDDTAALNDRARGIYYWEANTTLYNVHDDDVYRDSYGTDIGNLTTGGTQKCTFLEALATGAKVLVILDPENNKAYQISTSHTLSTMTPTNFPSTIVPGGVVLDNYLFVMDEDGIIYNSAVGDADTFAADGFITAERDKDKGVYLGKHHDHIVAFGTRTIEFLYDAGNATGSPLTRRSDISYNVGCADGQSVWENGDITFFIGSDSSGALSVYKLENFKIVKVSKSGVDSYLTQNIIQESIKVIASGMTVQGHTIYTLTMYVLENDSIVPDITLIYDNLVDMWGIWSTTANSHTTFPLVGWTKRTGGFNPTISARAGEGVLYNGDLITISENITPLDTIGGNTGYFASDYITDGYFTVATPDVTTAIPMTIRTGLWDGGTNRNKIMNRARPIMEETGTSQTLTLKWTKLDEQSQTFTSGRALDTSKRQFARQGGRFTKRGFELGYSGDEQIYLESLEMDFSVGNH